MFRFLLELNKIAVTLHVYGNVGNLSFRGHIECYRSEKCLDHGGKKNTFCVQHIQSEYLIVLELEQEKTRHTFNV